MFERRKGIDARKRSGTRTSGSRLSRGAGAVTSRERAAVNARRASVKQARTARGNATDSPRGFFSSLDWGRVRIGVVGVVFSLLWLSLWARAYYLQIIMGPEYADKARRQHTTREVVAGSRGNIMDRNGNILAKSVDCRSLWADPSRVRDKQNTALKLARELKQPVGKIFALLNEQKRFVWIARKLDYHTAEKLKALALPGINLETESERVYPYKYLAGQLLGFVDIDNKGIEGLEKAFDETLSGRKETRLVERDAAGRRLSHMDAKELGILSGKDVRLSIDLQVQFFAEDALAESVSKYEAKWGGCLVVDVASGDILAWAQYPFFDPNNVQASSGADRRNRLAMDMLEQGSTIKSFLIAAALEEGVVTPETEINCEKGVWRLRNVTLHDTHPYAKLSVDKVLHVSSNIGAAKIGLMLGANTYRDYLVRLGFGEPTRLPLASEARGILRTGKKWTDVDLANASFGQSFSATLVQMAQAYLCLAGSGEKRLLKLVLNENSDSPEKERASGPRIFSEKTARVVRAMMREVVEENGGTGKAARIPGIEVGGKTGTAQKASKSGGYGKERVGSFVGILPADNPRYLILVLLDEPSKVQYGGIIAAPVFRHVALSTLAYHGLLPDAEAVVPAGTPAQSTRSAQGNARNAEGRPGQPVRAASGRSGKELSPAPVALSGTSPAPLPAKPRSGPDFGGKKGEGFEPSSATRKRPARLSATVPSVVGLGMRSAVEVFAGQGIVPVIRGKGGVVVRQVPEAGAPWPDNRKECTLWLEERAS